MNRSSLSLGLMISSAIVVGCQSSEPTSTVATVKPSSPASPVVAASTTEKSSFDETMYLFVNPDVKKLIQQGKYKSGLAHYTQVGQTAKKADGNDYETFFTGTSGNDTVRAIGKGKHSHIFGVALEIVNKKDDPLPLRPRSLGKGEVDVLIGTQLGNEFVLGSVITSVNPKAEPFYVGKGDADYARIQKFTKGKDMIILAGEAKGYKFLPKNGNVQISTIKGDLIAIVERIDKLSVGEVFKEYGIFTLK